jgi:hypothetical protein
MPKRTSMPGATASRSVNAAEIAAPELVADRECWTVDGAAGDVGEGRRQPAVQGAAVGGTPRRHHVTDQRRLR